MKKLVLVFLLGCYAYAMEKAAPPKEPAPSTKENGPLVYQFEEPIPTINCTPERLTTIFLEPGESVQSKPVMGDTLRWEYELLTSGSGPAARTSIVLKPKRPDIMTDIVIATDRRSYQLRVASQALVHDSEVRFTYPLTGNFPEYQAQQEKLAGWRSCRLAPAAPPLNFAYSVTAKESLPFTPRAVYDDTHQTFLKMPPSAKDWGTAVLQTGGPNGCETVNYRVNGDSWVIDRLFDSAELVSGSGKKAQRVSILRDGATTVDCSKAQK
ncbi:MAG: P-type conjugative transfer protein TrbG [Bryobacterales bacterium]|jgi:P-type conjugative transfer protein TrbG|nr:P-type conjugative transfer protein TrbG [Bryobacterales bacterium]